VLIARNKLDVHHEISDSEILSFLFDQETGVEQGEAETAQMPDVFKDIDKESTITLVEIHQSSMGKPTDTVKAFHAFIVFKTVSEKDGEFWWSIEKDTEYIILQRSRNKDDVNNNKKGVRRKRIRPIKEDLIGRGNLLYLFTLLWGQQLIPTKYDIIKSNCQTLVAFISKQVTEEEYEYQGVFKCSSHIANKKGVTPMNVVGTEKMKEGEDILKETRQFYKNPVAPSPTAARNVADDTGECGDDQRDPALAYSASRTLSKHGPSERLFSGNKI
jgi:hypothetical protein